MITQTTTPSALIRRINRKLAHQGLRLCTAKEGTQQHQNMGRYYVCEGNTVKDWHIDLAEKAKELNAIAPWEHLAAA